jgi:uncharacterized membrane protein
MFWRDSFDSRGRMLQTCASPHANFVILHPSSFILHPSSFILHPSPMALLALLFRWLHILAAMAAVGGPLFMRLALFPAAAELPPDQRRELHEGVRRRWSKVVHAAILFLLVTGLYNFIVFIRLSHTWGAAWEAGSENATLYQILFGVKFLLALPVFFIASALSGRSAALARFREQAKLWLTVNLLLGILIVCIAGQMRMMHAGPNGPLPAATAKI